MSELRIMFDGIMIYGPPPVDTPGGQDGPLHAIMPRIERHESRYSKLNHIKPPHYIPEHTPVIFTKLAPLPGSRTPNEDQKPYSIWYPKRQRVQFRFSPSADPSDLRYVRDNIPGTASPSDLHDIAKLADIRKVWPDRGRLRREMLEEKAPVSHLVACQVFVPSGHVGSHGEFKKADEAPAEFQPPRTPTPIQQPLLPQLVVSVKTERVDIDMYSLDTGEHVASLAFLINDPASPSILRVVNADPNGVTYVIEHDLDPAHAQELSGTKPKMLQHFGDIDFEACYALLEGHDDGGGLPIPWVPDRYAERNCNGAMAGTGGT